MIRNLAVATLVAYPAFAIGADQVPDIKGKWIGKTYTIIVGKGGHWPKRCSALTLTATTDHYSITDTISAVD